MRSGSGVQRGVPQSTMYLPARHSGRSASGVHLRDLPLQRGLRRPRGLRPTEQNLQTGLRRRCLRRNGDLHPTRSSAEVRVSRGHHWQSVYSMHRYVSAPPPPFPNLSTKLVFFTILLLKLSGTPIEPECTHDSDCPLNLACINNKCRDPCVSGMCTSEQECRILNTTPLRTMICLCPPNTIIDANGQCKPIGTCRLCRKVLSLVQRIQCILHSRFLFSTIHACALQCWLTCNVIWTKTAPIRRSV